jgi:flagellar basal-body rod modification protein FlgD
MDAKVSGNSFPDRALNIREKSSGKKTTDPLKMKKEFGDKNLADILNSVADPNYKASKRKVKGVGNAELGKDAFFKLMLTQLKQQDPTNPLKSHEMAAQLAQFSSVEQLTNMNNTLTKMSQKGEGQDQYDVLNLIGKKVSGDSGQIDRKKGDRDHKIEFQIPQAAEKATVSIKDDKGMEIKKYELKDLKQGKNQIVWNGLHADGKDARVGQYSAHISAQSKGRKISASTEFQGAVDGVKFTNQGPVLMVDGKSLNLRDVKMIEEMNSKPKTQPNVSAIRPDTKKSEGAVLQNKDVANLDTAQMDKGLRQRITGTAKGANKLNLN